MMALRSYVPQLTHPCPTPVSPSLSIPIQPSTDDLRRRRRRVPDARTCMGASVAAMALALQTWTATPVLAEPLSSIPSCTPSTACVSTSSFRSPSQYLPPWLYDTTSREAAQRRLSDEMSSLGASVLEDVSVSDRVGYLHVRVPYTWAGSQEIDDVEFVFKENVVLFKSQATGPSTPDPPFCWRPGCINGPRQRGRLEELRDRLGWLSMETDEDKKWVPLLLH